MKEAEENKKGTKEFIQAMGISVLATFAVLEVLTFGYTFQTFCAVYLLSCFLIYRWM